MKKSNLKDMAHPCIVVTASLRKSEDGWCCFSSFSLPGLFVGFDHYVFFIIIWVQCCVFILNSLDKPDKEFQVFKCWLV